MLSLLSLISLALYVSAHPAGPGIATVKATMRPSLEAQAKASGRSLHEQIIAEAAKIKARYHHHHHSHNGTHTQHLEHHKTHHHAHVNVTHPHSKAKHPKRAGSTGSESIANVEENKAPEFVGPLTVGSAKQDLTVFFDTGLADTVRYCPHSSSLFVKLKHLQWLPITSCIDVDNNGPCDAIGQLFNSAASTSFVNTGRAYSQSFADGSAVRGAVGQDSVQFGSLAPITFDFGAVNQGHLITNDLFAGRGGLGFPSESATGDSLPFSYAAAGLLAENVFGTRFSVGGESSILTLGGPAVLALSDYQFSPIVVQDEWIVLTTSASVNGQVISGNGVPAAIDSGSQLISLPTSLAQQFWAKVPGSSVHDVTDGVTTFQYPCNFDGPVGFGFQDVSSTIFIDTALLSVGQTTVGGDLCFGGVIGDDVVSVGNEAIGIFGDIFFASAPLVFNMNAPQSVGFVNAVAVTPTPSGARKIRARITERRMERVKREQSAAQ